MVNEMGNINSSGDQENVAAVTQQKGQVSGNADGVKEENNTTPEGEDYQEKSAALATYDTSIVKEPQLENSEDDKTDEDTRVTQLKQPFQRSEAQTGANDTVSEVTNIETHTSEKVDQPLKPIFEGKDEVHDQTCNKKGEVEGSLSHDEVSKSDPVESSSVATEIVQEYFISASRDEKETPEKGRSGQNEDKNEQLISSEISLADKTVVSDANDQYITTQRNNPLAEEFAASAYISNEEKHEVMSAENHVENGYSTRGDLDETTKVKSNRSDAIGTLLADSPQITPSSSFAAVLDPEDKCMVHTPETEFISNESENVVQKCDLKKTESFMQAVHEMQIDYAAPSVESHPKEATEEKLQGNNINNDSEMDYLIEEDKARGDINVQPDILHYDYAPLGEQYMNSEEIFEMVPEIGLLPTKSIGAAINLEEESSKENGILEKATEGDEKSNRKEIMEECNADLTEHNSCEFIVTKDSGTFELKISEKEIAKIADFADIKNAQNVQPSPDTLAFSNEKCAFTQMVPKFHYDTPITAPESIGRLSLHLIPEKSTNEIELHKSPSFDFGVHRRSLESDQTPLLCPEKTPTRSLSVGSNAKFSNSIMRTEYNRSSLDNEAVAVQEKTIRMERSDSDISKAPLLGLLNKGENGNLKVTSETQQNHVADMKGENWKASEENETSLTSTKGSGKRKPGLSFFTTCICCTAATHY